MSARILPLFLLLLICPSSPLMLLPHHLAMVLLLPCSSTLLLPHLALVTERVHTLSSYTNQLITSSTLGWASIRDVQSGLVKPDQIALVGRSAVCRARDGVDILPGRTDLSGGCLVEGRKEANYQVLVDLGGIARLEWKRWDMFSSPHIGTVAFNQRSFVGSLLLDDDEEIVGELDYKRGMNGDIQAIVDGKLVKRTEGRALVETEPVRYQLEEIQLTLDKEDSEKLQLGSIQLERSEQSEGGEWQEEVGIVRYTSTSLLNWGQVAGTVRGLPAKAVLERNQTTDQEDRGGSGGRSGSNGSKGRSGGNGSGGSGRRNDEVFHFRWGIPEGGPEEGVTRVSAALQRGTGSLCSLSGDLVTRESQYSATLVSVYRDGSLRRHPVNSLLVRTTLENVSQTCSPPTFLSSGLPSPTTTPPPAPPSTTSPTTTTTSTLPRMRTARPTPTLFPPPPPPAHKPNPLKQFYPEFLEAESTLDTLEDSVQIAMVSSSPEKLSSSSNFILLLLLLLQIFQISSLSSFKYVPASHSAKTEDIL